MPLDLNLLLKKALQNLLWNIHWKQRLKVFSTPFHYSTKKLRRAEPTSNEHLRCKRLWRMFMEQRSLIHLQILALWNAPIYHVGILNSLHLAGCTWSKSNFWTVTLIIFVETLSSKIWLMNDLWHIASQNLLSFASGGLSLGARYSCFALMAYFSQTVLNRVFDKDYWMGTHVYVQAWMMFHRARYHPRWHIST